jgi:putative ABC transport system permease protein
VGVLLGILAAIAPAAWATRTSLAALMQNVAVRGGGGHARMRRGMVVVQVALTLVLLSSGGLVVRSFGALLRADPGFNPRGVLSFRIPLPEAFAADTTAAFAIQHRLIAELATLPGVRRVSAADALPLSSGANQTSIEIPGAPGNTGNRDHDRPLIDYIGARTGYFETMGMRFIEGRPFEEVRRPRFYEAVIDHVVANQFFPSGGAIGARIPFGGSDTLTVVGVVRQARLYDVHEDSRGQIYMRAEDGRYRTLTYVVRTERDPTDLVPEVRSVVRRVDSRLALADVRSMDQVVGDALRQQRLTAVLVAGFSLGALLLAAMGLFGVVSASVTRRRHELAVRCALGADRGRVLRLVLGEGARLIGIGMLIGVPATYYAGRAIQSVLVGVSPTDPVTLGVVGLGLAAVALAACYLPARRVLEIDPARSLRHE